MLADVLPHLATLSRHFQKSDLDFGSIEPSLNATKTTIEQLKREPGQHEKKLDDFLAGLQQKRAIAFGVSKSDREGFNNNIRQPYLLALQSCLGQRFPDLPLISALCVLVPSHFPKGAELLATYGNNNIDAVLSYLDQQQVLSDGEDTGPVLDPTATYREWTHLKSLYASHVHLQQCGSVQTFVQELSRHHRQDLPNLLKLANWALAIPFATADCERDLSRMMLIKTDLQSRLKNETLCNLMRLLIDGPPLAEFAFEDALSAWHAQKERQLPKGHAARKECE